LKTVCSRRLKETRWNISIHSNLGIGNGTSRICRAKWENLGKQWSGPSLYQLRKFFKNAKGNGPRAWKTQSDRLGCEDSNAECEATFYQNIITLGLLETSRIGVGWHWQSGYMDKIQKPNRIRPNVRSNKGIVTSPVMKTSRGSHPSNGIINNAADQFSQPATLLTKLRKEY